MNNRYLTYEEQKKKLDEIDATLRNHPEQCSNQVPLGEKPIKYKYNENEIINELEEYIDSTYKQHYVGKNNVQVNDLIIALGHAEGSYISNAIEYLARYGKKDGKNKKDLLKAIHNIMLLISNDFYGEL